MENQTPKPPTSHDYAKRLREAADFLESRPSFAVPDFDKRLFAHFNYSDKEPFVAAVRALGTGTKTFDDDEISFAIDAPFAKIIVAARRTVACRLIRPAEYECDPLLSPDEEKELGGVA